MADLIPCEYCGLSIPSIRYSGHAVLCALTSSIGSGGFAGNLVTLLDGQAAARSGGYEDNLRLQEAMGGPVRKACRDINAAAPVANEHHMDRCPVCLEHATPQMRVRKSAACQHEFCAECMERWLSDHTTCPVCVADVSVNGGYRFVMDSEENHADMPPLVPSDEPATPATVRPLMTLGRHTFVRAPGTPVPAAAVMTVTMAPPSARPFGHRLYSQTPPGMLTTPFRPRATEFHPLVTSFPRRRVVRRETVDNAMEAIYHFDRVREIIDGVVRNQDQPPQ